MTLWILANTVGNKATAINANSATSTGYSKEDITAGPRSRFHRNDSASAHNIGYTVPLHTVTHCVLARADKFKGAVNATSIEVQYAAAHTTDSTTAVGSMDMVGYREQDWVIPIAQTSTDFRLKFNASSTYPAYEYSSLYFSNGFHFGTDPQISGAVVEIPKGLGSRAKPLRGNQYYETEQGIDLEWEGVELWRVQMFRALPLWWPIFLYDDEANLWDYKLEHVLISEPWREIRRGRNNYDLSINFRRLRHYD